MTPRAPTGALAAGPALRATAPGFLAGFLAGELFLLLGLAGDTADVFTTSPSAAFALAVLARSVALYGLLFGVPGGLAGGALGWLSNVSGRRAPVFAWSFGGSLAVVVFACLTVWWQLDVLSGLPLDARERWWGALWQVAVAFLAGLAAAGALVRLGRKIPGRPPAGRIALIVLVMAGILWGTSGLVFRARPAAEGWPPRRVVLVGLDGVTFRVLSPLLRAGELPTFERLVDEGAWGTFLTYGVASSPVVWTTVATGRKARDHGITDFVTGRGAGYRARLVRSSDRRVPALWNVLSRAGLTVGVVDWFATSPPEEVNGAMVTGLSLRTRLLTSPPGLAPEIAGILDRRPLGDDPAARQLAKVDRSFAVAAHLLRGGEPPRFLAVYDRAADDVQHRFWKHYRPQDFDPALWRLEAADVARYGDAVPAVYRRLDRRLGELLDALDEDALLIVVSDHGQLAARRPRVQLELDRVLAALGLATLRDGALDPARSRAYTLAGTRFSPRWRVNVNVAGREPQGRVSPAEAAGVVEEVVRGLRQARLADGTPLFGRVEASPGGAADVLVEPSRHTRQPRYLDRAVVIGGAERPLSDFARIDTRISGDHDHQGVIFVHGRGVRPGPIGQRVVNTAFQEILHRLTDRVDALDPWLPWLGRLGFLDRATTLDVTPTVLYALGLPVARDMAGRPLTGLFAGDREIEWTDSYGAPAAPAAEEEGEDVDEEALEQLRDLGYIN